MSATSMGSTKQVVRPPQRGIFPLDHMAQCKTQMQHYVDCLQENKDMHHKCRDLSRNYLECRMNNGLMAKENLDQLGFSEDAQVEGAREYDNAKELAGFVAGKHIAMGSKWWWQRWLS